MTVDNLLEEAVATMSHDYEATILSQMPFSLKPRLFDPRRPFS